MMDKENCVSKLHACALGLACGITKGLFLMIFAWVAMGTGHGDLAMITFLSNVYHGYSASFVGGLLGGAYGIVIGFVFGYIFGKIYNLCVCCCRCCCCCKSSSCADKNKSQ